MHLPHNDYSVIHINDGSYIFTFRCQVTIRMKQFKKCNLYSVVYLYKVYTVPIFTSSKYEILYHSYDTITRRTSHFIGTIILSHAWPVIKSPCFPNYSSRIWIFLYGQSTFLYVRTYIIIRQRSWKVQIKMWLILIKKQPNNTLPTRNKVPYNMINCDS